MDSECHTSQAAIITSVEHPRLQLKDFTLGLLGEDLKQTTISLHLQDDQREEIVKISFFPIAQETWASDDFVDLPPSNSASLRFVVLSNTGDAITSFRWDNAPPISTTGQGRSVCIPALDEPVELQAHDPIHPNTLLYFVIHSGTKSTSQSSDVPEPTLQERIETAEPNHLDRLPLTLPPKPLLLVELGRLCHQRFKDTRDEKYLTGAISSFERVVRLTPPDDEECRLRLYEATDVFLLRRLAHMQDRGELGNVQRRIIRATRLLDSLADSHALVPQLLHVVGQLYYWKFFLTKSVDDISWAIYLFEKQASLLVTGSPDHVFAVNALCFSYSVRYHRATGKNQDIQSAIDQLQSVLQNLPLDDREARAATLIKLGSWYRSRSIATSHIDDVTLAIQHQRKALSLTPPNHSEHTKRLVELATHIEWRSNLSSSIDDTNEAISICERVMQSNPRSPQYLASLASNLVQRALLTTDVSDLSRAITLLEEAVDAAPPNSDSYNSLLVQLSRASLARHQITSSLSDLVYSNSAFEKAVSSGYGHEPEGLARLGKNYHLLFLRAKQLPDLTRAIQHLESAIAVTSHLDYRRPDRLSNLADALTSRYEVTGDPDDIERAIANYKEAISLTPDDGAHFAIRTGYLAEAFSTRFKQEGDANVLTSAISTLEGAFAKMTLQSHPIQEGLKPFFHNAYADLLSRRFKLEHNKEDLVKAIAHLSPFVNDPRAHPMYRLGMASQCAIWSMWLDDAGQAMQFGAISIEMLPETTCLEQTVRDHYSHLRSHSIHGVACAGVALHFGQLEKALEWLEQGRCLVWAQIAQLQTPVDILRDYNSDLARRLEDAGKTLTLALSRERTSNFSIPTPLADTRQLQDHTKAAEEWRQTIKEIRKLERFGEFLKPLEAANILDRLPSDGIIVLFSIRKFGCDALALVAGKGIVRIPLRDFTSEQALQLRDQLKNYFKDVGLRGRAVGRGMHLEADDFSLALTTVLADLWTYIVKPVVDALGYTKRDHESGGAPLATFHFFPSMPLACTAKVPASAHVFSDYVVSSYSPNVTALLQKLRARTQSPGVPSCLLLVSQPNTPGLAPIPATAEEVQIVRNVAEGAGVSSVILEEDKATVSSVAEAMKNCSWTHFACHAVQNTEEPLQSGIHLHDGRLEIVRMMKEGLSQPEHAFLSACQTSTGDETLEEEVVHMAATMLAAGYKGVIATMWSIKDDFGPKVAKSFYEHILEEAENRGEPGQIDCGQSVYALDETVRNLRSEIGDDEEGLLTWVPYIHLGV